jgi:hypothetical protein
MSVTYVFLEDVSFELYFFEEALQSVVVSVGSALLLVNAMV